MKMALKLQRSLHTNIQLVASEALLSVVINLIAFFQLHQNNVFDGHQDTKFGLSLSKPKQ